MKWENYETFGFNPAYMLTSDSGAPTSWGIQKITKEIVAEYIQTYPLLKGKIRQGWYIAPPDFEWPEDSLETVLYCNVTKRYARTLKAAQVMVLMLHSLGAKS